MLSLIIPLLERVGLVILLAYLLLNVDFFKKILTHRNDTRSKLPLILIFSLFAILSNFTGIEINGPQLTTGLLLSVSQKASIANTRVLTIGVAGLISGPFVGTLVGLISGIVRTLQGGEAAYTYLISSILVGTISGFIGKKSLQSNHYPTIKQGILSGAFMEIIQMCCILIFYPNVLQSIQLLKIIALPMIFINSLGTAIFLSIITRTLKQEESARAVQTHDVLDLANHTLPYFRTGMNEKSCTEVAIYIHKVMKTAAVSITNKERILAHVGVGSDHHFPSQEILTDLSKQVILTGQKRIVKTKSEIGCNHQDCPLAAAIVVPLYSRNQIVGTLKFYFTDPSELTHVEEQLADGLAKIFSSQIELGEMDLQSRLLKDAEIKSLQSQVNPHFFFNAINTISAMIRIDSEKARELLLKLSQFFRGNIQSARKNLIPLQNELEQVQAYLSIEQTRFPEKYHIHFDIEQNLDDSLVPPFLIQILIENAIKHAFVGKKENNKIEVSAQKTNNSIIIIVQDNGQGIPEEKIALLGKQVVHSSTGTGSALENLNRRLNSLFGSHAKLTFESTKNGTTVSCKIPYKTDMD